VSSLARRIPGGTGFGIVVILLIALVALNIFVNPARYAPVGLATTLGLAAPLILAALASTPSILSGGGGIDISIGPMIGLINVVLVKFLFMEGIDSPFIVLPLALALGTLLGAFNGFLVAYVRLQPIVATLGAYLVFVGLAPWVMRQPGGFAPDWLKLLGSELSILPIVAVGVVWAVVYRRPLYRYLMAVGGSDKAAYTSGIEVARVRLFAYAAGGFVAAFAALAVTALIGSGDPNIGPSITVKAIAAVALGGVSLAGGRGGFIGAAAGALVIFNLELAMTATNLSTFVLQMIFGVVLVFAVIFNAIIARRT
jgi:ribose transport system permease protein